VKRVYKALQIHESDFTAKQAVSFINREKDEGRYPTDVALMPDRQTQLLQQVYWRYQALCQQSQLVDFAELLLRSLQLLEGQARIAKIYHDKFRHILVDEFQDTNALQFRWLQALLGSSTCLTIVGDDDQSIYGWRGAQIENILRFNDFYPGTETVRLEQNYRSSATILQAANGVISNNQDRLGKSLWTEDESGEPILVYSSYNEMDEAKFVVEHILKMRDQGISPRQQAILYRSNAQSRALEEILIQCRVPYKIYGGLRFFDRAEIRNAMAYLRLLAQTEDDAAFERIINVPARGLGDRTVQSIRDRAQASGYSMWNASLELLNEQQLTGRAAKALTSFIDLIQGLQVSAIDLKLSELVALMLTNTQLLSAYQKESHEQRLARQENLQELVSASQAFDSIVSGPNPLEDWLDPEMDVELVNVSTKVERPGSFVALSAFVDHVALEAGEMQADRDSDAVQLMTIHASKGLEFPVVYLTGLEEGLFPSQMSLAEPGRIEEERRLCYVGITRAERRLILTYAESRRIYGEERRTRRSRFLKEIPTQCLEEVRMGSFTHKTTFNSSSDSRTSTSLTAAGMSAAKQEADSSELRVGHQVRHASFGEGVIINAEGRGAKQRVQVNFTRAGSKWLMASIAKLEPIDA